MGMIQCAYGSGFALEAFGGFLLGGFDGDDAVQARVAGP